MQEISILVKKLRVIIKVKTEVEVRNSIDQ